MTGVLDRIYWQKRASVAEKAVNDLTVKLRQYAVRSVYNTTNKPAEPKYIGKVCDICKKTVDEDGIYGHHPRCELYIVRINER